jgi:hypothetical protein
MDACSAGRTGSVPGSGPATAGSLEAHSVPDPNRGIEETGQPKLNAQSPSGRGDGDCALSYSIPIRFDFIFLAAEHNRARRIRQPPDRYRVGVSAV